MRKILSLILAAVFSLTACSEAGGSQGSAVVQEPAATASSSGEAIESYTVTDVRGKEIAFDAVPERVATVGKPFPSLYYAIEGATDHIVGCNPSSIKA